MARGPRKAVLVLSAAEREELERWSRRPTSAQALATRARIVLLAAEGLTNLAVAAKLGITNVTVGKWRSRFVERRADGLLDEPRPGAPRTVSDKDVESVVRMTLESTPTDATHWSTRSMASRSGLSQSTVSRIWRAFAGAGGDDAREFVVKRETDRVENRRLARPGFSGDGEEARRAQRLAVEVDGEAFGETGEISASDRQNAQCHASCRRRSKQSK